MNLEPSYTLEYLKDLYKIGGKLDKQFKNIFSLLNGDEKLISDAFFDLFYRLDFDEEKKVFKKTRYSLNPTSYFELEKINSHLKIPVSSFIDIAYAYVVWDINRSRLEYSENLLDIDILTALDSGITISYNLGLFSECINKALISQSKDTEKKSIHELGGLTRASNYHSKKLEIFDIWERGNHHSYASLAQSIANDFNLSTKTIEKWLSSEYSKKT